MTTEYNPEVEVVKLHTGSGVTELVATEAAPVPTAFAAVTVKVYAVPFVSPVTTQLNAPVDVHDFPPGDEVTVYTVRAFPKSLFSGLQETVAEAFPGTANGVKGAVGAAGVVILKLLIRDE